MHACFRKIRVTETEKKKSKLDILMQNKKNILKKKEISKEDNDKIELLDKEITLACEDKEWEKLVKVLGSLETNTGCTNNTNVWKEMAKAYPKKSKALPTGVKNVENKVITNPKEKKTVILDHFLDRTQEKPPHEDVKNVLDLENKTFELRLESSKRCKSPPIEMNELETAIKSLKIEKSRDPAGLISDIFREGVIGSDLKLSLLMMFNRMKDDITIPECLRTANVTMLYKKKCKLDLNNWRGIYVTSALRTLLMKIIHNRTYEKVSSSMSDSQIGAQKKKSVRNHIFVLNSIISDVLGSVKKPPIDLCVMDFRQMFDSEELKICLNALFEAGVQDDLFALIYESNKTNVISVKTPSGTTKQGTISNKIMQGDVLGPLLSNNMVDSYVGKEAFKSGNVYLYKNKVPIPPLAMVDDTLGVSLCGYKTKQMSEFLNTRTKLMNLQFGCNKCEKLHIGKKQYKDICPTIPIDSWKKKNYLKTLIVKKKVERCI